ncbi:hypothetical protein K443DRAFT_101232, partial [Laccaria amethystina LaAM-08-1]
PPKITPCTAEGTPMAIIPPCSPARKRRLGMHLYSERGSLALFCLTSQSIRGVFRLPSTRSRAIGTA